MWIPAYAGMTVRGAVTGKGRGWLGGVDSRLRGNDGLKARKGGGWGWFVLG